MPSAVGASGRSRARSKIEQSWVLEGSFSDHDGVARAGEFFWRTAGSVHETHSAEGAVILAIYRKPSGYPVRGEGQSSAQRRRR